MVDLIGFAHSVFARGYQGDIETLMSRVAQDAIEDAAIEDSAIDAVVIGHFNPGFIRQGFTAGLSAGLLPGLLYKPALRVENACASGSAAVHQAEALIKAGKAHRVLVIGVEIMSQLPTREVGNGLLQACYVKEEADVPAGFAGIFAQMTDIYAQHFGDPRVAMAKIAAKNHANGAKNPWAQLQQVLSEDFCAVESEKNPRVVGRLLRSDCSPISDGAAALVMVKQGAHAQTKPFVRLRSTAQATDLLPMSKRDMRELKGVKLAFAKLLHEGNIVMDDLDLIETHDCFTIAELLQYEAFGICPTGQGIRALEEGTVMPGGKLPVNLSGGLKAKGHPIGATGVSMHVLAAWQLLGRWRSAELPRSRLAAVFNMGGAGVANYASLLERV